MSGEYTKNQLNYRRSLGVSRAWERERELVRKGRGTRPWSLAEQKELLRTGRVKGYHGHHMKSVSRYPEYADQPKNIQFLDNRSNNNEHLKAHRGDFRNESNGRYNVRTGQIHPMKDGTPRAMYSYELKDKAIEKRGYEKYANVKPSQEGSNTQSQQKDGSTVFSGKSYGRAFVRPSGKAKEAQKGARYGKAASSPSEGRQQSKAPGRYGQKASALAQAALKGSYGRSAAQGKGGSPAPAKGAAPSAGRGAGGHGQGGGHR